MALVRRPTFDAEAFVQGLDLQAIGVEPEETKPYLRPFLDRATGSIAKFRQITPEERFRGFHRFGFRPYGIYLPDDPEKAQAARRYITETLGAIPDADMDRRLQEYYRFQDETSDWERLGIPGRWTGQMAVARSTARFRVVGCARRWGKTELAAHEALSVSWQRPRSVVWAAAPIAKLVARAFDIIIQKVYDYRIPTKSINNTMQNRRIEFENGSVIEGMSLDNVMSAAGATVDYAIIDEAAQIDDDTWERGIQPVLIDRNGQALLISSFEGDEGIFARRYMETALGQSSSEWAAFAGRTADNFYIAPQGDASPALVEAKRTTDPLNYLEQYGGVPAHAKYLVYPEFKEIVHTGHYPFDPQHPVILVGDPSGGANAYCVLAFQDYPEQERLHVVGEIYAVSTPSMRVISDDVIEMARRQEWADNVTDVVMDSAVPAEVERWQRAGFNAYPVFEKPQAEETYPLVRRCLRDPVRYNAYHERVLAHVLAGRGLTQADYEALPLYDQREILVALEEHLNDPALPAGDIDELRACAMLRIDQSCVNTIREHKQYQYVRPKTTLHSTNMRETARKWNDHAVDCVRYFLWQFHRWDGKTDGLRALSIQDTPLAMRPEHAPDGLIQPEPLWPGRNGFLHAVREMHAPRQQRSIAVRY